MAQDHGEEGHDDHGREGGREDEKRRVFHGHEGSDEEGLIANFGKDDHSEGKGG